MAESARLLLAGGSALQAAAHAAGAATLVDSGHVLGSILALFCLVGVGTTLRLLLVDCVEGRAVVIILAVLTLIGFVLSTTAGYPGQAPVPVTAVGASGALASVVAGALMLAPRAARRAETAQRATYHR